jgi:hypothetical protein
MGGDLFEGRGAKGYPNCSRHPGTCLVQMGPSVSLKVIRTVPDTTETCPAQMGPNMFKGLPMSLKHTHNTCVFVGGSDMSRGAGRGDGCVTRKPLVSRKHVSHRPEASVQTDLRKPHKASCTSKPSPSSPSTLPPWSSPPSPSPSPSPSPWLQLSLMPTSDSAHAARITPLPHAAALPELSPFPCASSLNRFRPPLHFAHANRTPLLPPVPPLTLGVATAYPCALCTRGPTPRPHDTIHLDPELAQLGNLNYERMLIPFRLNDHGNGLAG